MDFEAFLADSVVNADGKLFVQGGGWNVIHAQFVPVRHPRIGIAVIVRVPYTETNQNHKFSIGLEDADGSALVLGEGPEGPLYELGADFNVGRPPQLQPGDEQLVPFAINLDGLVFHEAIGYNFVLRIDGQPRKRLSFRVALPGPA